MLPVEAEKSTTLPADSDEEEECEEDEEEGDFVTYKSSLGTIAVSGEGGRRWGMRN